MKISATALAVVLLVAFSSTLTAQKSKREFYQLKVYTLVSDAQEKAVDKYLEEAFLPALHRAKIQSVGVFKPIPNEKDTVRKIYVLIPFSSMDQFLKLDPTLAKDAQYQTAGAAYIDAPFNQAPYARIESTLLQAFTDMPAMATPKLDGPKSKRVYELRSYESATEKLYVNKVDMFNAGGEITLFDKLGFNAVFYGEVLSGSKMPNLMYMTTFSDMDSRNEHWKAFSAAPEWKTLSAMPKYQKNVSKNDTMLLYPAEYSDY
jgi:hypothetical protein